MIDNLFYWYLLKIEKNITHNILISNTAWTHKNYLNNKYISMNTNINERITKIL